MKCPICYKDLKPIKYRYNTYNCTFCKIIVKIGYYIRNREKK